MSSLETGRLLVASLAVVALLMAGGFALSQRRGPKPPKLPPPPYPGIEVSPTTLRGFLSAGSVAPGETLWLKQGTYTGAFDCYLDGTDLAPIRIRAIPGHVVVFDGWWTVRGSYTWFDGFEITRSSRDPLARHSAIESLTSHHKFINLFAHDNDQGIATYNDSTDTEIYGCILWRNGWVDTDRNHGHGIYIQNAVGEKWVIDNILLDGLAYGIHAFGQQGNLVGLRFLGNVSYNNQANNFFVGGTSLPIVDLFIHDNVVYSAVPTTLFNLGYWAKGNTGLDCQSNLFLNGKIQLVNWRDAIVYRDNLHVTSGDIITYDPENLTAPVTYPPADWDANTYLCNKVGAPFATDGSGWFYFDEWKSKTGCDANSAFGPILPADITLVRVRPNQYDISRAHVAVYVRGGNTISVSVDLNAILAEGQSYAIYRVPDLTNPVITGIHSAGALTGIPLNGLEFSTYLVRGQ